jgi:hypothetical protein
MLSTAPRLILPSRLAADVGAVRSVGGEVTDAAPSLVVEVVGHRVPLA